MRIAQIIQRFGGVCEGDASLDIQGVTGVESAGPHDLTFAADEKRLVQAEASAAACVLVPQSLRGSTKTLIRCESPQRYTADLLEFFNPEPAVEPGIHPSAVIGPETVIDPTATIGPHVTVGRGCRIGAGVHLMSGVAVGDQCEIGERTTIHPRVTLYRRTRVGARVLIHAGAVIGADGFGYFADRGALRKWPHVGNVVIEDDVEIGANTCIDRGKFGSTLIQRGAKIDNLVMIAHNCRVGKHSVLAGQTGLSGSVVIGDWVTCGGQVGIADHHTIGDGVSIAAQSGILDDIPPGIAIFGHPAKPARQGMAEVSMLSWLAENRAALRKLVHQAQRSAESGVRSAE